jgi:hypothetical protein
MVAKFAPGAAMVRSQLSLCSSAYFDALHAGLSPDGAQASAKP